MKADLSRDYYADLELPPTADIADIKKQFRKLGKPLPLPLIPHSPCSSPLICDHQLSSTIRIEILERKQK